MMFFKKICVLMTIAFAVYADDAKPFTGAYVGANLGGGLLGGECTFEDSVAGNKGKFSARSFGLSAGGMAGYMKLYDNKSWFAGEIYYNIKTTKSAHKMTDANNADMGKATIKNKSAIGGAALMGAAVNPRVILFAKAAMEYSSFDVMLDNLQGNITSQKKSHNILSMIPTAGLLMRVSDSFIAGVEGGYVVSTKKIQMNVNDVAVTYNPTEYRGAITFRFVF